MLTLLLAQAAEDISLFDQLQSELAPQQGDLPIWQVVTRLGCAAMVGWVLGLGYRLSYTGKKLKPTMHHTLVMLCIGGALVWLVVGNNIVRAFGLAGTIGLIRYRTTLRDPKDTTVLFFSMVLGMAIGLGHYTIAIVGCLFVFCTLIVMRLTHVPPLPKEKDRPAEDLPGGFDPADTAVDTDAPPGPPAV